MCLGAVGLSNVEAVCLAAMMSGDISLNVSDVVKVQVLPLFRT